MNKKEEGVRLLKKAVEQGCMAGNYYLALHDLQLGRTADAIEKAELLCTMDTVGYFLLGKIYEKSSDFNSALKYYEKASKKGNFHAFLHLCEISTSKKYQNQEKISKEASLIIGKLYFYHSEVIRMKILNTITDKYSFPMVVKAKRQSFSERHHILSELKQASVFLGIAAKSNTEMEGKILLALTIGEFIPIYNPFDKHIEQSRMKGIKLLEKSIEHGSNVAKYHLARWYMNGLINQNIYSLLTTTEDGWQIVCSSRLHEDTLSVHSTFHKINRSQANEINPSQSVPAFHIQDIPSMPVAHTADRNPSLLNRSLKSDKIYSKSMNFKELDGYKTNHKHIRGESANSTTSGVFHSLSDDIRPPSEDEIRPDEYEEEEETEEEKQEEEMEGKEGVTSWESIKYSKIYYLLKSAAHAGDKDAQYLFGMFLLDENIQHKLQKIFLQSKGSKEEGFDLLNMHLNNLLNSKQPFPHHGRQGNASIQEYNEDDEPELLGKHRLTKCKGRRERMLSASCPRGSQKQEAAIKNKYKRKIFNEVPLRWFKQSAKAGNENSIIELCKYYESIGKASKCMNYLHGNAKSENVLLKLSYISFHGLYHQHPSVESSLFYLKKSASLKHKSSLRLLSFFYFLKSKLAENMNEVVDCVLLAYDYCKFACEYEDIPSMAFLSYLYEFNLPLLPLSFSQRQFKSFSILYNSALFFSDANRFYMFDHHFNPLSHPSSSSPSPSSASLPFHNHPLFLDYSLLFHSYLSLFSSSSISPINHLFSPSPPPPSPSFPPAGPPSTPPASIPPSPNDASPSPFHVHSPRSISSLFSDPNHPSSPSPSSYQSSPLLPIPTSSTQRLFSTPPPSSSPFPSPFLGNHEDHQTTVHTNRQHHPHNDIHSIIDYIKVINEINHDELIEQLTNLVNRMENKMLPSMAMGFFIEKHHQGENKYLKAIHWWLQAEQHCKNNRKNRNRNRNKIDITTGGGGGSSSHPDSLSNRPSKNEWKDMHKFDILIPWKLSRISLPTEDQASEPTPVPVGTANASQPLNHSNSSVSRFFSSKASNSALSVNESETMINSISSPTTYSMFPDFLSPPSSMSDSKGAIQSQQIGGGGGGGNSNAQGSGSNRNINLVHAIDKESISSYKILNLEMKELIRDFHKYVKTNEMISPNDHWPLLLLSTQCNEEEGIKLLIECDANINILNEEGKNCFAIAAETENHKLQQQILELHQRRKKEVNFQQYVENCFHDIAVKQKSKSMIFPTTVEGKEERLEKGAHVKKEERMSKIKQLGNDEIEKIRLMIKNEEKNKGKQEGSNENDHYLIEQGKLRQSLLEITKEDVLTFEKNNIKAQLNQLGPFKVAKYANQIKILLKKCYHAEFLYKFDQQGLARRIYEKFGGNKYFPKSQIFSRINEIIQEISIIILHLQNENKSKNKYDFIIQSFLKINEYYNDKIKILCSIKTIQEREDLVKPPILLHSTAIGSRILKEEYKNILFPFHDKSKSSVTFSTEAEYGTHVIKIVNGIHFKGHPHAPAIEFMIDSLNNLISGQCSTPTELIKIYTYTSFSLPPLSSSSAPSSLFNSAPALSSSHSFSNDFHLHLESEEIIFLASKTVTGPNLRFILESHCEYILPTLPSSPPPPPSSSPPLPEPIIHLSPHSVDTTFHSHDSEPPSSLPNHLEHQKDSEEAEGTQEKQEEPVKRGKEAERKEEKEEREEAEENYLIDSANFTGLVISSLLSNPQDGKPDNYIVEFLFAMDKSIERMKVISIDNDIAFANPIIQLKSPKYKNLLRSTSTKNPANHTGDPNEGFQAKPDAPSYAVDVKNVIYFFPQMNQRVDKKIRHNLINQNEEIIIINWINQLIKKENEYEKLCSEKIFTKENFSNLQIPMLFVPGTIHSVYLKLKKIKYFLIKYPKATLNQLFQFVEPLLFEYYQNLLLYVQHQLQMQEIHTSTPDEGELTRRQSFSVSDSSGINERNSLRINKSNLVHASSKSIEQNEILIATSYLYNKKPEPSFLSLVDMNKTILLDGKEVKLGDVFKNYSIAGEFDFEDKRECSLLMECEYFLSNIDYSHLHENLQSLILLYISYLYDLNNLSISNSSVPTFCIFKLCESLPSLRNLTLINCDFDFTEINTFIKSKFPHINLIIK